MHKKPINKILAYNGEYKRLLISETETIPVLNSHKNKYKKRKKIKNIIKSIIYIILIQMVLVVLLFIFFLDPVL